MSPIEWLVIEIMYSLVSLRIGYGRPNFTELIWRQ